MTRIPVGAPSRSVTALGWTFTLLGVMVLAALALPEIRATAWTVLGVAVLAMLFTVAGVGLTLRLDWARRTFIAMLMSGLGLLAAAMWLQAPWLQAFELEIMLAALASSFGVSLVLSWAILQLVSPRVRREFA